MKKYYLAFPALMVFSLFTQAGEIKTTYNDCTNFDYRVVIRSQCENIATNECKPLSSVATIYKGNLSDSFRTIIDKETFQIIEGDDPENQSAHIYESEKPKFRLYTQMNMATSPGSSMRNVFAKGLLTANTRLVHFKNLRMFCSLRLSPSEIELPRF